MKQFFETMFFRPKWYHFPLIVLLSPLSLIYGIFMLLRRMFTAKNTFSIPILSVGNLIVGGSGKTPFVIALASRYKDVTIISRGYGRESQGLIQVSAKGKILTTVWQSGDEPMLMAKSLPNASVIVSEDREIAIELAMREGAKLIILDDGFNRVNINKFEILLEPQEIKNYLPFPAGAFREFYWTRNYADILAKEEQDFKRKVIFENLSDKMLLVTAISNPQRLDKYLPEGVVSTLYLDDHAYFDENELAIEMQKHDAKTLLVTQKDAVKMEDFKLPLSLMKLELEIEDEILSLTDTYINTYFRR
ncbi:tetraacyldisaccharide 4'-kinase [Sulfurovum sp.]|uniref:tetraacyldisaccharide 4'-kinase n=1 Tax=Sulfurovum sp. TaxID=1969726 RepID=UPI002867EED9|nr:tetraacyldisaccharide 4'-kinase [Sulfurovum sp.]